MNISGRKSSYNIVRHIFYFVRLIRSDTENFTKEFFIPRGEKKKKEQQHLFSWHQRLGQVVVEPTVKKSDTIWVHIINFIIVYVLSIGKFATIECLHCNGLCDFPHSKLWLKSSEIIHELLYFVSVFVHCDANLLIFVLKSNFPTLSVPHKD